VQWLGHLLPPVSNLLQGFTCVCAQVSCSVVSNWSLCEFCGRVYCDILSIFLIPQFCLFLRHQTMDKVQKHNSFNTNTPPSESYRNHLWKDSIYIHRLTSVFRIPRYMVHPSNCCSKQSDFSQLKSIQIDLYAFVAEWWNNGSVYCLFSPMKILKSIPCTYETRWQRGRKTHDFVTNDHHAHHHDAS
jgi:hypothetical protein